MTTLVHPSLLDALAPHFYPSSATLQSRAAGIDAYGVANGAWANVAGLVGIDCSVNRNLGSRRAQEIRRADMTIVTATHVIALAGHYPAVTAAMRAVVGVVIYNVLSVVHDAQSASTYLLVELVST